MTTIFQNISPVEETTRRIVMLEQKRQKEALELFPRLIRYRWQDNSQNWRILGQLHRVDTTLKSGLFSCLALLSESQTLYTLTATVIHESSQSVYRWKGNAEMYGRLVVTGEINGISHYAMIWQYGNGTSNPSVGKIGSYGAALELAVASLITKTKRLVEGEMSNE